MFCNNCGNKLPDDAKFCGGCGTRFEPAQPAYASAEQTATQPSSPPVYAPPMQTPPPYQQSYSPPQQQPFYSSQIDNGPLSVGQYIGMFLLLLVPILNIVLLFVWGFGGAINPNKKNFARAYLIMIAIGIVIGIVLGGVITSIIGSIFSDYYYYY